MVYSLLSFLRIKQKTEYNIALKYDMLGNYLDKFVFEVIGEIGEIFIGY